jgi:hypothetical protein
MGLPSLYQLDANARSAMAAYTAHRRQVGRCRVPGADVLAGRDRRRPGPADGIHAPMAAGLSGDSPARTIGLPIKVTPVS